MFILILLEGTDVAVTHAKLEVSVQRMVSPTTNEVMSKVLLLLPSWALLHWEVMPLEHLQHGNIQKKVCVEV